MKDSEFTELLNLYLDHEITAADAARLEAEVQSNPARRRIYQDYCRMQKACKMLADDFTSVPAEAPDRKVVAFEQASRRRSQRNVIMWTGGLAAAATACVAVVFGSRTATVPANPGPQNQVVQASTPAPEAAPVLVAATTEAESRRVDRPRTTGLTLRANAQVDPSVALTSAVQNDPHFAWMQDVRLTPVQMPNPVEQLRLEVNPSLRLENRTFNSAKPLGDDVSSIAIRFQK